MGKINVPDIAQTQWIKELASTGKNFIEESQVLNEGKEKLTQKLEEIKLDNERTKFLNTLKVRESDMLNSTNINKGSSKDIDREER